jgi:hypothetical protein
VVLSIACGGGYKLMSSRSLYIATFAMGEKFRSPQSAPLRNLGAASKALCAPAKSSLALCELILTYDRLDVLCANLERRVLMNEADR